jgi:hypothetical protein
MSIREAFLKKHKNSSCREEHSLYLKALMYPRILWAKVLLDTLRILETHEERHHVHYRVDLINLIWYLLGVIAAAIC